MHSLVSRFCCHRTKLLCWENHPYVGRQRVAVSRGDYRELRLSFLENAQIPSFYFQAVKVSVR